MASFVPPPTQGFNPLGFLVPAFQGLLQGQEKIKFASDLQNLTNPGFVPQSQQGQQLFAQNIFQNQALQNQPITPGQQQGFDIQREGIQQRRDVATTTARRIAEGTPFTIKFFDAQGQEQGVRVNNSTANATRQSIIQSGGTFSDPLERENQRSLLEARSADQRRAATGEVRATAKDIRDRGVSFGEPFTVQEGDGTGLPIGATGQFNEQTGEFKMIHPPGKAPTASEVKARRFNEAVASARATPEEDRTKRQQAIIDRDELGSPLVKLDISGDDKQKLALTLRREFSADQRVKNLREAKEFVDSINIVHDRSLKIKKNFGPTDIALAKDFQKLTDIRSTVREGEFATTFEGQRLINRIRGKIDALLKGGLGFTQEDRKEIRDLANEIFKSHKGSFNEAFNEFSVIADEGKLNEKFIFGGAKAFDLGGPSPQGRNTQQIIDIDKELAEINKQLGVK
ncbi:hypothetical protein LCGC14_0358310 [marine sediment metagenome]|uniref:Uncharacterized protein n=1 Tax=marine sediment metagenome TaxID=412755 RepID=A0A0F9T8Z2_9ZZZZ